MTDPNYPSNNEIEQAADIISRLPRGFLPYPIFMAVASKVVTPSLELAVLREVNGDLQILLTKRPDDDAHWPSQWHVTGTVIRSTDSEGSYDSCFKRILHDELHDLVEISAPVWISTEFWEIERGRELDQLFCAELESAQDLPDDMRFFSADSLPAELMRHHADMIAKITDTYRRLSKPAD